MLLVHREISQTQNLVRGYIAQANTAAHQLCHSGRDESVASGMAPLMQTDAEKLMHEGVALAKVAFENFLRELDWSVGDVQKTVCHQVGAAHRKLLLETLGLKPEIDFATFPWLGNTGAASLPSTLAIGIEKGHYRNGDQIAMLGIGSGINVLMLGLDLNRGVVAGGANR